MKRLILLLLSVLSLMIQAGCQQASTSGPSVHYTDFREIPGVTQEEIDAVEQIQRDRNSLLYGMLYSTEAFYAEDGRVGGYSALLCDWLSELFQLNIEPVICSWDELIHDLDTGAISLTGELTPSPERVYRYFMTDPVVERVIKTFQLETSEDLYQIAESRPLRLLFLRDSTTFQSVNAVADFSFSPVWVDSYEEALLLLEQEDADAFLTDGPGEAAFDSGTIVAEEFYPLLYGPVSLSTADPSLEAIITVVQKYLQSGGAEHLSELYRQGHQQYLQHSLYLQLTAPEQQYLDRMVKSREAIPALFEYNNYPISFYNEQEDEYQGIAIDILDHVSEYTGLTFYNAGNMQDWTQLIEMLENGEAAMITELVPSHDRQDRFFWTDEAYSTDHFALLSLTEFNDVNINQILHLRVGLLQDTIYEEVFHEWFPGHSDTRVYSSNQEAFDALERGEIDLIMATHNLLLSVTNYLEQPGFKANLILNRTHESRFGFHRDYELLASIVSKAQKLVDTQEISERWTRKVFDYRGKIARIQVPYLIALSVLLAGILALVIVLLIRNRQMNKMLEQTVRERTDELEIQTQAAQTASRSKGDFLARMSHEIRAPMSALIGMTRLAKKTVEDPAQTAVCLEEIGNAASHLLEVINDVLELSKLESGKYIICSEPFVLHQALQEVEQIFKLQCRERNILFTCRYETVADLAVLGDRLHLKQVLINLLSNAVKFTDSGGTVMFTVDVVPGSERMLNVRFIVSDTGIGMASDQVDRLFLAFEQADHTISSRYGGTGLGLAITRQLVDMMGGTIQVQSKIGAGSEFSFELQFERAEWPPANFDDPACPLPNLNGHHILVVDDIEINRILLAELLSETGAVIDVAENGTQAANRMEQSQEGYYSLIFMDVFMPELNGYEATQKIRSMPRPDARTVPIIALTADDREDPDNIERSDMNCRITKPVDSEKLSVVLNRFFTPDGTPFHRPFE